jgi:hypothetical protein
MGIYDFSYVLIKNELAASGCALSSSAQVAKLKRAYQHTRSCDRHRMSRIVEQLAPALGKRAPGE